MKRYTHYPVEIRVYNEGCKNERTQYRANLESAPWWYLKKYFNFWKDVFVVNPESLEPEFEDDDLWFTYYTLPESFVNFILDENWTVADFEDYLHMLYRYAESEWCKNVINNYESCMDEKYERFNIYKYTE